VSEPDVTVPASKATWAFDQIAQALAKTQDAASQGNKAAMALTGKLDDPNTAAATQRLAKGLKLAQESLHVAVIAYTELKAERPGK
jgi:hypothetical protein